MVVNDRERIAHPPTPRLIHDVEVQVEADAGFVFAVASEWVRAAFNNVCCSAVHTLMHGGILRGTLETCDPSNHPNDCGHSHMAQTLMPSGQGRRCVSRLVEVNTGTRKKLRVR